ncbi:MAG: LamG domain-containing protein, partial [bacterium]|nr:LamG domain-containing protein [bacterium]
QGQYALDSSPYGNDGVLGGDADPAGDTADPQWQLSGAGITNLPVAGHGLVFDGGDHVLVPDSASLSMTSSLTIETWARLNNPGGSWQQLVFKGDTRSGLDPYYLRVDGGQLELGINSDLNELSAAYADALQFDWDHAHHIAGVFADETDQLRIYVDGILQAVSLTALQPLSDQQDMHVRFGKEARNLQHLDGALDEVRIWNVARSGCEIWNNMHRPLRGDEPGLVGYWRFDEGEGQDVLDLTPFGNHGTLGFDSNPGSDDPSWELSGADVGAPPADPIGWTVPEMISEVSSGEDWNVAISGDELEIYIGSERDGFAESELYRAVRPSINDAFSEPVPVWELSIPGYRNHDNVADLSADGLRIYFNRHYWHDPADFFVAERSSPTALWGAPVPIDSLNTAADEYDLAVSADELAAVFTSSRSGQNRYWVASRNSRTEAWGNISLIDSLAGLVPRGCDLAADGLTLYVTADGPGSLGSYDIWQLTRISVDSAFGVPVHMPELSSDVEEWDVSLSGDGGAIYMVSRRIARLRSGNVYISHRLYADESVPGDLDCDGDLDLDDYGLFAPCHTGPDGAVSLACAEADYVSDGYVDLRDFGRFQVLFTGQAP